MSTLSEHTVEILNDLIRINNDRIEGYSKADEETDNENEDLINTFQKMISQSNDYITDLSKLVIKNGGKVSTGSTNLGKLYRAWMEIQMAFSVDDRKNILNACEYGEDAAQKAYKMALDEDNLSEEARALIALQKNALRDSHDLIKAYRDREKAHA